MLFYVERTVKKLRDRIPKVADARLSDVCSGVNSTSFKIAQARNRFAGFVLRQHVAEV